MPKAIALIGAILIGLGLFVLFAWSPTDTTKETPTQEQSVLLYVYSSAKDTDSEGNILCSEQGLVEIERTISTTDDTIIDDTIRLLLSGTLNDADTAQGLSTEFPLDGLTLESSTLTDGALSLTFADPMMKTSGGSCRVGILWKQIEKTAMQFDGVETVLFSPQELFQP